MARSTRLTCYGPTVGGALRGVVEDEAGLTRYLDHKYVGIPNWITPYNEGADALRIWQVTRATTAAPFYFDQLEASLEGQTWSFKDGGIRENNPAGAAWSEFISLYNCATMAMFSALV